MKSTLKLYVRLVMVQTALLEVFVAGAFKSNVYPSRWVANENDADRLRPPYVWMAERGI